MAAEQGFRKRRRRWLRSLGCRLGAGILKLSGRLVRLQTEGMTLAEAAGAEGGPVIYAFWHGRFWLLAARLRTLAPAVLVSLSEDGEVIARVARHLGYHPVRGSSSRGGSEGLQALEQELLTGRSAAITPDGPRGPRHRAQMGVVALAARSGKPILPVGGASHPAWNLRSWDRFQIPRPGARAAIVFGTPIYVAPAEDLEPARREVEVALLAVERRAEELLRG